MTSVVEMFLFGGDAGTDFNNELWKYNVITTIWTWLGGSTSINTPIPLSYPPSITNAATCISDSGSLWIYGGNSTYTNQSGPTADLWNYEPSTNIWTRISPVGAPGLLYKGQIWLSGNSIYFYGGVPDLVQPGSTAPALFKVPYASQGAWQQLVAAGSVNATYPGSIGGSCLNCNPGVRVGAVTWVVSKTFLYLYGGSTSANADSTTAMRYNDVWMVNVEDASLLWYWIAGDKGPFSGSSPGTPQPLASPSYSYVDYNTSGFLWVYGGLGPSNVIQGTMLEFEMATKQWHIKPSNSSSLNVQYPAFPRSDGVAHPGNLNEAKLLSGGTHLYILGGYHSTASVPYEQSRGIWDYDTQANSFKYLQDVDDDILSIGSTVWECNGSFYFFGGAGLRTNPKLSSYLYVANNLTFEPTVLGGGIMQASNYDASSGLVWPGAREYSFGWVNGTTLWMYGGTGITNDTNSQGYLDEVWAFETTSGKWTFVSGSKVVNYSETTDSPGGRIQGQAAANGTHMWYFGGAGAAQTPNGQILTLFTSLWQYSIETNKWLLLADSSNDDGKFPPYTGEGSNPDVIFPASRANGGAVHLNGSFYLFGGSGLLFGARTWADLWEFDLARNMWFFLGGSKEPGYTFSNYDPKKGTPTPVARALFSYLGTSTGMWIYGGHRGAPGAMELSDLWFLNIRKDEHGVITDPCLVDNGGCDYSRTCSNFAGSPLCSPCPTGTHLNGSICTSDCGDRYCNATIGEDCVSCPFDCKTATCEVCGDNVCSDHEGCATCFEDCGPCVTPTCNCNKHGTCDRNGHCLCNVGWAGPTCTEKNQPITVSINSTSPGLNLGTSGNTSFTISLRTISEVYQGITYHSENIQNLPFTLLEIDTGNKNKIHNYSTIMENGASLNITLWQFAEPSTTLNVAGVPTTFQANTVKLSVRVGNWRFNSLLHSLFVVFDTGSPDSTCVNSQENSNSSVQWFMVNVGDVSLYGQLIDQAELDGRIRTISFSLNNSAVTAVLPHFWEYADMDPHFSVLLGDANQGKCGHSRSSGVNKKLLEIVVPIAVFFAILLVLFIIFASRIKSRMIVWKSKKFETSMSMDELSSESTKPEIEKRGSMEANTAAGRFHFRL